jgi:hypothetical protein
MAAESGSEGLKHEVFQWVIRFLELSYLPCPIFIAKILC